MVMPSLLTIGLCALLFIALGVAWVVGVGIVRRHWPRHLVHFYILMAAVRMVSVLTVAGVYILFISDSSAESKSFALMMMVMYVLMMLVMLIIKH